MDGTANNIPQAAAPSLRRTWIVLALPPVIFLAVVIIGSIGIGIAARGDAALITERVQNALPVMLLVVQLLLAWAARLAGAVSGDVQGGGLLVAPQSEIRGEFHPGQPLLSRFA